MDPSDSATESPQETQSLGSSPGKSTSSMSSQEPPVQIAEKPPQNYRVEGSIVVPDMFSSIMAVRPIVNPYYHDVKPKADSWITKVIGADEKWDAKNRKVDLCYLASMWAPAADEDALRMMVDWNHWVFLFDDQFDEGFCSQDPAVAQNEVERTLAILEDTEPPVRQEDNPIRYVFQTCWDRLKLRSDEALRIRWKTMHKRFFDGLLNQVHCQQDKRMFSRDVQEYMDMRRGTIGAAPAICLTEYACGVRLPNEVVMHPSLQECMVVSADLVLLVNDILSYKKDLALGVDHNLITLLMEQGLTTQQAVDKAGTMIDGCYKRWFNAPATMPVWGEEVDRQVWKFVEACRNVALGNLYWSFKTGRYLGSEGEQVHETRTLTLPVGLKV